MRLVDDLRRRYAGLGTGRLVLGCAVLAALLHFPGLMWPLGPDEAGYTLVARAWDPAPDSLYGPFWVDRPPLLLLVYRIADHLGGPYLLRLVAALGCFLLVLVSARTAYLINGARAARWTAIVAAALTSSTMIDPVSAKGEILGIPIVMTSIWLAVGAMHHVRRSPRHGYVLAFGAGVTSTMVLGMKQNMVTGLVFGGVLLLTSLLVGDLSGSRFRRLGAWAALGALAPVVATLAWCLAVGVRLEALWYAVFGFRSDALDVIAHQELGDTRTRAIIITLYFVLTGMALFIGWLLAHVRPLWRSHAALTAATLAVIAVDGASLGLSGSFWRPYLHLLTPGVLVAVALLAGLSGTALVWAGRFTAYAVASTGVALVAWLVQNSIGVTTPTAYATGEAIETVAGPHDSIMVHGGRADLVLASELATPYDYLWSLPMRALDADRAEMTELLTGSDRVTWFVEWIPLDEWTTEGVADLEAALDAGYVFHGVGCEGAVVYLRDDVERPDITPRCDDPWRAWDRYNRAHATS